MEKDPQGSFFSSAADDLSVIPGPGAYSLTLPIDAPLIGPFGTGTLPIVLAAQPLLAGQYIAKGSATGYQSVSVNKNISLADATQDFILVP